MKKRERTGFISMLFLGIALILTGCGGGGGGGGNTSADYTYDPGSLDTAFGTGGVATYDGGGLDYGWSVTVDSNGKVLVAGYSYDGSNSDMAVWRFNADGSPDTAFGTGGVATYDGGSNDYGWSVTVDSNGKVLVAGSTSGGYDMAVWRFNADGSLDTAFGTGGVATYDGGGTDYGYSITIDSNGKVLVAGSSYSSSNDDMAVWRFNADGSLDTAFGTGGVATYDNSGSHLDYAYSVTVDSNGKVLVAGRSYNGSYSDMAVWRFNANGSPDTAFGTGGVATYDGGSDDYGRSVTVDSNGKVLVAGYSYNGSDYDVAVWRYIP